jgi:hypothetical protein
MAFNPFHRFRKHQKVFFAILTIVCMFVFVLQFGSGDPIQRLLSWIGAGRGRGAVVAKLYGKKIHEADLEEVLARRRLANNFMIVAATDGQAAFVGALQKRAMDEKDASLSPMVKDLVRNFGTRQMMARFGFRRPEEFYAEVKRDLFTVRRLLESPAAEKDPEEAKLLGELAVALGFQAWNFGPEAGDFYFGGSRKPDDLLDFLIWKRQADQLKITLTEADVRREVVQSASGRDVFGGKSFDDSPLVQAYLQQNSGGRGLRASDLLSALTDELRASMAQEALLGQPSGARAYRAEFGVTSSPAAATPDEFLNYYRSMRTTLKAALLPVPVEKFVAQVQGAPSEDELVNLYEKYKDFEPAPDRVEPGFKEPRKIRVQYLMGSADDDYYKAEAKKQAALLGIFSDPQRVALLSLGSGGHGFTAAGPAGLAAKIGFPLAFDPVRREYETYLSNEQFLVDFRKIGVGFDLQDRSALPLAALGQALGAGLSRTGPLAVPFANGVAIRLHERATVQAFAAAVLGGATKSPWMALGLAYPSLHTKQPFDVVKPKLLEKFETDLANQLLRDNLDTVKKELAKLKNRPEEEAVKYLEKAAKEYHLRLYSMKDLKTQYTLAADPELKALKGLYAKLVGSTYKDANFAAMLLAGNRGTYDAHELPERQPFNAPQAEKEVYLFWRSEDQGAKVRPFEAVRGQVEEAWRFRQARALALKKAEEINAALKGQPPADAVKYLRDQKLGDVIELDNVARLVEPERQALMSPTPVYLPYQPPEDKIPYPRGDFVKELLTLTQPGESKVLRDRPVSNFYVAVLQDRSVPDLKQFSKVYQRAGDENPIWGDLMIEQRRHYREMLLGQLRADAVGAANLDADGRIKIPEDVRLRNTDARE